MPIKAAPQLTSWSYSRLHDYEECPAKASYKHIKKLADPGSPAMARGTDIHKSAELWSTGQLSGKIPQDLWRFEEEFVELRKKKRKLATEQQLAVNAQWQPCDWFGKDAWLRVVIDCSYDEGDVTTVIDYKTGKVRTENATQLDLYALVKFAYTKSTKVNAGLWYLDAGELVAQSYDRAQVPELKKRWVKRTKAMLTDQQFKPKPGNGCRWCPYSKAKGGPCAY